MAAVATHQNCFSLTVTRSRAYLPAGATHQEASLPSLTALLYPMDIPRTSVDIHRIDENMPFYPNMERYLSVQQGCLHAYTVDHDWRAELEELSEHLTKWQSPVLMQRLELRDPEATLDLAIRSVLSC